MHVSRDHKRTVIVIDMHNKLFKSLKRSHNELIMPTFTLMNIMMVMLIITVKGMEDFYESLVSG